MNLESDLKAVTRADETFLTIFKPFAKSER